MTDEKTQNVNMFKDKQQLNLAEDLHNYYELVSISCGWETQEKCRVKFAELPINNRMVMYNLAGYVKALLNECKSDTLAHLEKEIGKLKSRKHEPDESEVDGLSEYEWYDCISKKEILALIKAEQEKT